MPKKNQQRILALDALRLLAAIIVLGQHLLVIFNITPPKWCYLSFFDATGAVIFFFILSGYALALSINNRPIGWRTYMKFGIRRAARILPLYWSALITSFLILSFVRSVGHFAQIDEMPATFMDTSGWQWSQWLLQTTLIMPGIDHSFAIPPVWTLMVEGRVAVVFPLLAWGMLKLPRTAAASILASLVLGSAWLESWFGGTAGLLGLFGLGIMTFRVRESIYSSLKTKGWVIFITVSASFYAMISLRYQLHNKLWSYYICALGSAGLVIATVSWKPWRTQLEKLQRFIKNDLSYGIYILHYPIFLAFKQLNAHPSVGLSLNIAIPAAVATTFVASYLLHIWVELPAIEFGKKIISRIKTLQEMDAVNPPSRLHRLN